MSHHDDRLRRAERGHHAALAAAAVLVLALPAPVARAAGGSLADEVRRLHGEVEQLLSGADRDLRRAPEAERERETEQAKLDAVRKDLAAAKAEAEAAEAPLARLEADAKAADDALEAERQKAGALSGWQSKALPAVQAARQPADALPAVTAAALAERSVVAASLGRLLVEPGGKAAAAFEEVVKAAGAPIPTAELEKAGARTRPTPRVPAKEPTATLDALALATGEAAACAGVGSLIGPPRAPRLVAGPGALRESFERAGDAIAGWLRGRRRALRDEAAAALPHLREALGSERLARSAIRLATLRGLRDVVREAAKAAIAVHAIPLVAEVDDAPAPKSVGAVLRALAKRLDVACGGGK